AAQVDAATGEPVPGVAQGAIQMGAFVGEIIARELSNASPPPRRPAFRYRNKGEMATIGRARAVADVGGRTFGGVLAWLLWSVVHVAFLVGFRNKLLVMVHWAWQWLVQSRGARLITGGFAPRVADPVDLDEAARSAD
ncbi:MAG: NAD(P)/FAD-dependent oxidoreductase, partial [Gemmatimonadetes bacterium]|nr:NAD(P)/FAD-dependent oxidoreductase [Gemmatimonadota bacterium]NNL30639.1 NAD(P)/FAD-dependent oxidoreductase [Gemmatimonadota bacterium]